MYETYFDKFFLFFLHSMEIWISSENSRNVKINPILRFLFSFLLCKLLFSQSSGFDVLNKLTMTHLTLVLSFWIQIQHECEEAIKPDNAKTHNLWYLYMYINSVIDPQIFTIHNKNSYYWWPTEYSVDWFPAVNVYHFTSVHLKCEFYL